MKDSLYNSFVVSYLGENYPNILNEIEKHFIEDVAEVHKVLNAFCSYFGIYKADIQYVRIGKYLNLRYKFIGAVLYLFQPAKLNSNVRLSKSLAKELKATTKLDSANLNSSIKAVRNLYLYKEFRSDIITFCNYYRLIK